MANPSRRTVLRAGVVAAAAAVPLAATQNAMSVVAGGMASGLRRSTFKPHLKSSFTLVGPNGSYRAKLVEVKDLATAPAGHDAKFRLLFKVRGAKPGEGTYRVRHRAVSAMDLFVSPVGGGDVYEAVVDAR